MTTNTIDLQPAIATQAEAIRSALAAVELAAARGPVTHQAVKDLQVVQTVLCSLADRLQRDGRRKGGRP